MINTFFVFRPINKEQDLFLSQFVETKIEFQKKEN